MNTHPYDINFEGETGINVKHKSLTPVEQNER